jgi:hypothetical protein
MCLGKAFISRIPNASGVRTKVIIKEQKGEKNFKKKKKSKAWGKVGAGGNRETGGGIQSLSVLSLFVVAVSCVCAFFLLC